jgi:hypothetical protein
MRIISKIAFIFIFLFATFATELENDYPIPSMDHIGTVRELYPSLSYSLEDYSAGWITEDLNNDGQIDYAMMMDQEGFPQYEANDFNKDGSMDDFYIYEEGILIIQEIDANYDQRVDLFVFLKDGIYIQAFEQDRDFDGLIDIVRLYGEE